MEHKTKDWKDKTIYLNDERLDQPYGERNETLRGMLLKRNKYLLKMFKNTKYKVELIGDAETPAILLDKKIILSAYVHNFNLNFLDRPVECSIIKTETINYTNRIDPEILEFYLENYEHSEYFKKKK